MIEITESKENESIHRLNVSGSTGPGRAAAPLPPASYGSAFFIAFAVTSRRKPCRGNFDIIFFNNFGLYGRYITAIKLQRRLNCA